MLIRNMQIKNFRGIQKMDWTINSPIACLIGPGDSTKSTILDAIEFALSPRWNIAFEDCDFYLGDTNNPIEIIVTIGQLPDEFFKQEKHGLLLRGWNPKEGIHDEPQDNDEQVLSIRLRVDKSLEPEWTVINDRDVDGHAISSKDREKLGMNRLGAFIDKHLYWGQGSALSTITTGKKEAATPVIVEAHRKAREAAKIDEIKEFKDTVERTEKTAKELGVKLKDSLRPALDPRAISIGFGAIALHDGDIPVRLSGLGSRRLITLGIQLDCLESGSPLLIDEIENGLEPHRIRHLLNYLQDLVRKEPNPCGQAIMTSHSTIVVVELNAETLYVVRSNNGETIVRNVTRELQGTIRKVPESLLGQKVVICEGKTEYGVCRSVEDYWINQRYRQPLAYQGAVLVEGGGDDSPKRALQLAQLGYTTCLFVDGDKVNNLKPDVRTLKENSVSVFHWSDGFSTEQRVASDLTWKCLLDAINIAKDNFGEESILGSIYYQLGKNNNNIGKNVDNWLENGISESEIRTAFGKAAKEKGWFKRVDYGEELGRIIVSDMPNLKDKETAMKLSEIEGWIYG